MTTDSGIDPTLLEIIRCPACLGTFVDPATADELVCSACGLRYPVRGGVPVLLVDEARQPDKPPVDPSTD